MDARSSLRDNNRNAMPPRQAPRARAPALTGIVILLLRPDRTRQTLGFLKETQSHESGFGAGFWSHECMLCRPKTSRVGVARISNRSSFAPGWVRSWPFLTTPLLFVSEQVEPACRGAIRITRKVEACYN